MIRSLLLVVALAACNRPAEERAYAELDVGSASAGGLTIDVPGGLAAVRALDPGARVVELWAQAPDLAIDVEVDASAAGGWELIVHNALPDAVLTVPDGVGVEALATARPTIHDLRVELPAGAHRLRLAPPDADTIGGYRVAAMADIQTALPTVHEVFARISAEPDVRFVVSMGDLTERAQDAEYALFEQQLTALDVPYYTTLGNHELWEPADAYFHRYGRASFQFTYRGVAFTFADSGDAGIDAVVHGWIDEWIAAARDRVHVFLTHVPPIDPSGTRAGAFRSRREAHHLLQRLAAGGVDLTLYGHIHTYEAFSNAGIPAYISGGGGATPEKWDGIGRHFLVVDFDPAAGRVDGVTMVPVD